jgi:hypothetical protein
MDCKLPITNCGLGKTAQDAESAEGIFNFRLWIADLGGGKEPQMNADERRGRKSRRHEGHEEKCGAFDGITKMSGIVLSASG